MTPEETEKRFPDAVALARKLRAVFPDARLKFARNGDDVMRAQGWEGDGTVIGNVHYDVSRALEEKRLNARR